MIDSIIASGHKYYFTFIEFPKNISILSMLKKVSLRLQYTVFNKGKSDELFHVQACIDKLFGSEDILSANSENIKGRTCYWYDFYITAIRNNNRTVLIFAYPYHALISFIRDFIEDLGPSWFTHKVVVQTVMDVFRNRHIFKDKLNDGIYYSVSKYSARIFIGPADTIDITGQDPLNSEIFDYILQRDYERMETKSIRLAIENKTHFRAEFDCDGLGNVATRIKKDQQIQTIIMAPKAFLFLENIKAFQQGAGLYPRFSLLEDE